MEFGESRSPRLELAYGTEHRETSVRNDDKMTTAIMITESDKQATTEPRVVIEADSQASGKFELGKDDLTLSMSWAILGRQS